MKKAISMLLLAALLLVSFALPASAADQFASYRTGTKGATSARLGNMQRAALTLNQTYVAPGASFSFNATVGPRTKEAGYVRAMNGRGVKVVGGGVAQVASALWLAVKNAGDITVVEKSTYGENYNQSYVGNSADAIVTDYSADTDFAFRYDGWGSVTIYTWVDNNTLYCEIYRNN